MTNEPFPYDDKWTVTNYEHDTCPQCLDEADHAITIARVTGSIGATHGQFKNDETLHSATVRRTELVDA